MNGYTDLTSNIENSRNCLRRIARHDDQEFSKESIINVMEKFVKTVNAMDETILVPCRLMDLQVGDSTDTTVPATTKTHHNGKKKSSSSSSSSSVREYLNTADLFNLYNTLNSVKVNLLWGKNVSDENLMDDSDDHDMKYTETITNVNDTKDVKGHIRRPSTVSMTSSNSTSTLSDSESEISNENDSGIESEVNNDNDKSTEMAKQFRTHLHGLHSCLAQMTEAANYLTARYQSDVGPV